MMIWKWHRYDSKGSPVHPTESRNSLEVPHDAGASGCAGVHLSMPPVQLPEADASDVEWAGAMIVAGQWFGWGRA